MPKIDSEKLKQWLHENIETTDEQSIYDFIDQLASEEERCPDCGGKGGYRLAGHPAYPVEYDECHLCNGTGKKSEEEDR